MGSSSNTLLVQEDTPLLTRQLVLIGGGHAHVAVLKSFGMEPLPGLRIILISEHWDTPYSGMLPGLIAGHYDHEEAYVDLNRLAHFAGADFYRDRVTGLDLEKKEVLFASRPPVSFDYLSINSGSTPATENVPGVIEHALRVKPIDKFLKGWDEVIEQTRERTAKQRIVTVGGGAAGVELTFSAQYRLNNIATETGAPPIEFEIVTATQTLLQTHNRKVQRTVHDLCKQRNIKVRCGEKITLVEPGTAKTDSGEPIPFDTLFWTTHASAPDWLRDSGLQLSATGFIQVDKRLASLSHDFVFAAGDVADLTESPRPKSGVFAVRQGAPLAKNLRLVALGFPPRKSRLQKSFLSLISTGDKQAIASKAGWSARGRWVWNWKRRIDLKWMRQYRDLPDMKTAQADMDFTARAKVNARIDDEESKDAVGKMRCGGCGAKVGALILHEVIKGLDHGTHPTVQIGLNVPDDAAVIVPPPGKLLVQSVDFFRSFINDPYLFGRIATNHALNDLFAMGASPASALVTATIPFNGSSIISSQLSQLLGGVAYQLRLHQTALAGGHTAESKELGVGLTVNGFADPRRLFKKTGLLPGDKLILTKPLGTGILFAADMKNRLHSEDLQIAIESMLMSNHAAVEELQNHGVSTCTDISGFGLIGHLREMFGGDPVTIEIDSARLPVLPGAAALAEAGFASSMAASNSFSQSLLNWSNPDDATSAILFDPQTAGGLLAAVPADHADSLVTALVGMGFTQTSIIGEVMEGTSLKPIQISGQPQ